jgi:hypothetical protein
VLKGVISGLQRFKSQSVQLNKLDEITLACSVVNELMKIVEVE